MVSLRLLSEVESRLNPSKVGPPSCGAIWSKVVARVSSEVFSAAVSVAAELVVSSLTASVSE